MPDAYVLRSDGKTEPLSRILCKNEEQELQHILELNHDLLPGDQVKPDDPRRWLLIKREMPVPDPNTGADRWSIDFLFADQDAIPTFVECKRFNDTRSRREVIGQMFEYAANGQFYWSKDDFRSYAEASAKNLGSTIEDSFYALSTQGFDSVDAYFERLQDNLREGQIRIIFFLEKAPMELRSLVDFLNKQMERSEILLVEAKQYTDGANTIIIPTLFGYTEEARQVKRLVTVTKASQGRKWDKASFFEESRRRVSQSELSSIVYLYDACESLGCNITWGVGAKDGSFIVSDPSLSGKALLYVYTSGNLDISYGYLTDSNVLDDFRERFKVMSSDTLGISIPDDPSRKRCTVYIGSWASKSKQFTDDFCVLIKEFRAVV